MNTVYLSETIRYMIRYLRVTLDEYNPASLPRSFLPRYGFVEILRSAFSAMLLSPALINLSILSFAWGVYWSVKFINLAGYARKYPYVRKPCLCLCPEEQTQFDLIDFYRLKFQDFLIKIHNFLSGFETSKESSGVLSKKLFLEAEMRHVQIPRELFDTYCYLQKNLIINGEVCQGNLTNVTNESKRGEIYGSRPAKGEAATDAFNDRLRMKIATAENSRNLVEFWENEGRGMMVTRVLRK